MSGNILILFSSVIFLISGCVQPESTISSLGGNNSPVIEDVYVNPAFITVDSCLLVSFMHNNLEGDKPAASKHRVPTCHSAFGTAALTIPKVLMPLNINPATPMVILARRIFFCSSRIDFSF